MFAASRRIFTPNQRVVSMTVYLYLRKLRLNVISTEAEKSCLHHFSISQQVKDASTSVGMTTRT